jgi:dTDP-glucose 4,6-dehydratase
MSRVAVTGGAGFVGSHLVDRLLAEGHSVVAVDNLVTGSDSNLSHLKNESRFDIVEHDVSSSFPNIGKIDALYHMASPASPIDFIPLAIPILKVGSYGTFNALEYAKTHRAWFLMASTSEVYGDPEVHPQREDYLGNVNPIGIRGVYDEAKRFSESCVMAYRRTNNLETSIVRIFNTYGPRMRKNDGRVIPNFISQALQNEPVTIHGDGSQTRSLCYVSDLVEGLHRFMLKKPVEPINLGNDKEMTVRDIAGKIVKLTASKSKLVEKPLPEGDPKQRRPDIAKARKVLGWEPRVSVDEGLSKTIDFFKTLL